MERRSAKYEIVRLYVRFAFWLTHKRIIVEGINRIPEQGPIIFAPNHQNALMDPLALVCTNPHQTVWLARADIFKLKATRPILRFLRIMPVYRIRDGKENLANNEEVFNTVIGILEDKLTIALFPEAAHSGKRRMLPHKKAIPRIALEAEEKNQFKLNLKIVPVGIFYSHYWAFNRSIIIEYGEPIEVDKFRDEYQQNPQKALLDLRDEIYRQLSPLVLNIRSETRYEDYEAMRLLLGKTYAKRAKLSRNRGLQQLYAEKELIGKLEKLEATNPEPFGQLVAGLKNYLLKTEKAGMTDDLVDKSGKMNWKILTGQLLAAMASLPVFVFGLVFNLIPFLLPGIILKGKIRDMTFMSTFNFVIGLIMFPLFYLIFGVLVLAIFHSLWLSLAVLILMPLGGKAAYQLLEFYKNVADKIRILFMKPTAKKEIRQLHAERENLTAQFFAALQEEATK